MGKKTNPSLIEKSIHSAIAEKMDDDSFKKCFAAMDERSGLFISALEQDSDRATTIISVCLLDNLLENLIRALYVKDAAVKSIFKNDRILQSFYSKIHIAYFSGLIPKVIYHDLKLVCEIRNKFAHEVTADLNFDSKIISQRIDKCEMRPKTMDDTSEYKIKFIIIVQQLIAFLCFFEHLLLSSKPSSLVETFKINDWNWGAIPPTKEKIADIVDRKTHKTVSQSKKSESSISPSI